MHILVTNDDGPPSYDSSPYILEFVDALRIAGHQVSVIVPDRQRSWIGKAHLIGDTVHARLYQPPLGFEQLGQAQNNDPVQNGISHGQAKGVRSRGPEDDWVLVDGSPATCAQLGLFHYFRDRPPIELVVSGPNYGRNCTALFSLSSGTIGAAMEAATFGRRAIALSFAFWSREHSLELIQAACRHSVRIIEHLNEHWSPNTDLYSINVPLRLGLEDRKIFFTNLLSNAWTSGSSFEEDGLDTSDAHANGSNDNNVAGQTARHLQTHNLNEKSSDSPNPNQPAKAQRLDQRAFKWAPRFNDVQNSIDAAPPGNDGWAIANGYTSITPLKTNFLHADDVAKTELVLPTAQQSDSMSDKPDRALYVQLDADAYVLPILQKVVTEISASVPVRVDRQMNQGDSPDAFTLQIVPYEAIDHVRLLENPRTFFANAYTTRKALIRKNFLWLTAHTWMVKHPDDTRLVGHVPQTANFELDYAEFLDDALVDCWDLKESFERQAAGGSLEWWILKPSMSDQGHGLRLFSTQAELQAIFDEWEEDEESNDEMDLSPEDSLSLACNRPDASQTPGTMISQLRHFSAQRYIENPLIFGQHSSRKFHIRAYVLAVGALKVYLFRDMLALFASEPYEVPDARMGHDDVAKIHLTNTCRHAQGLTEPRVLCFDDLPDDAPNSDFLGSSKSWKDQVRSQIENATAAIFEAASRDQMIHFQALPNAFEIFGIDWLVDASNNVWLLELNAFPDFKQCGFKLTGLVDRLWRQTIQVVLAQFLPEVAEPQPGPHMEDLKLVLNINLGR